MNVRTFLINQGLIAPHDLPSASGEFRVLCPNCSNEKKKCYVNGLGKGVNCKHCGYSRSWRGFVRLYEPPTLEEQALEHFVSTCQETLKETGEYQYLLDRGLTPETIESARIGYCLPTFDIPAHIQEAYSSLGLLSEEGNLYLADRIVFPYITDGYVETVRGRSSNSRVKYMGLPHTKAATYRPFGLDSSKTVCICEGEIDSLILGQAGYNIVGLPGVNHYKLVEEVASYGMKVYLAFDGDEAGRNARETIVKLLPEVYAVELPDEVDVNDYVKAFGLDSFKKLYENASLYILGKFQKPDDLSLAIEAWQDWAWTNTELLGPKISWAPRLESALSGWSSGLFLLGALPNSGKSCFMVKSAYHAAKDNPDDTIVCYLTLDDDQEDALTRLVSLTTGINFEQVRSPRYSFDNPNGDKKPELLKLFFEQIDELKTIHNLYIRDSKYGRSLSYVRNYISTMRKRNPDKHLIFFIDSLAKVTPEDSTSGVPIINWKAHLAAELKYLSTMYNACIVTPADFRKINDERRPTNDDLKDASELAYEANCVLLGFNELNVKNDADRTILKWKDREGNIWPVLEMNLSKNKKTLFRGNIRFKFYPPTSEFFELTLKEEADFNDLMKAGPITGGPSASGPGAAIFDRGYQGIDFNSNRRFA